MTVFKPMLAAEADLDKLQFPLLASAKLDGVRAIIRDGVVYSRSNKPIPNKFVQQKFSMWEYFDGELIFGEPTAKDCYRRTVSAVMSESNTDGVDVRLFAFDHVESTEDSYAKRYDKIHKNLPNHIVKHEQILCTTLRDVLKYEELCLEKGYEGLILRSMDAPYKNGRSTVREGYLLKLKRFTDGEFEIVDFEEREHNGNEATTNELGRTKRSSHQAGKTGRGDLGALVLRYTDGVTFNCGTGFTDDERARIWQNRKDYIGLKAKVKYFAVGMKDLPRHPVWLGLRDRRDMS